MRDSNNAIATLPEDSAQNSFKMSLHGGRDQVAVAIADGTWENFEYPFPTYFYACAIIWPGTIIDVGANTGFYSLLGACASRSNRVISFEPDHEILASLNENVSLNNLGEQVSSSSLALSSKSGVGTFYVPTQEHGLIETSGSLEAGFKSLHSELRKVEMETLDRVIAKSNLADSSISMIKIDVEGHERHVLTGAKLTIINHRPILFLEVLNNKENEFFNNFIKEHGYIDVPLSPAGVAVNPGHVQFVADAWNHAFVPKEKVELFLQLVPPAENG